MLSSRLGRAVSSHPGNAPKMMKKKLMADNLSIIAPSRHLFCSCSRLQSPQCCAPEMELD